MEFKLNIKEECKDNMWPNQWEEIVRLKKELEQIITQLLRKKVDESENEYLIDRMKRLEEFINREICVDFGWGAYHSIRALRQEVEVFRTVVKPES